MNKPIVAILYDFDKTLSVTDMQNYKFIPDLGLTPDEFWQRTSDFSEKNNIERVLSYMYMMIVEARKKGIKITRDYLRECGKNIKFYPGVLTWFKRINEYGEKHGVKVEHYLVSSGTKEIVEGSKIFNEFTRVYSCEYYYDKDGEPIWPKLAINYTQKTQYVYRVAKGALNEFDDKSVNDKRRDKPLRVKYSNIIYMGDGMTDIACMTLVKKSGGTSIAIYPEDATMAKELYGDNRVNFLCAANYEAGKPLEKVVQLVINRAEVENSLEKTEITLANK